MLLPKTIAGLLSDKDTKDVLDLMNIILNMLEFNDQDKKEILEIATKLKQRKGMKKSLLQKWLQ